MKRNILAACIIAGCIALSGCGNKIKEEAPELLNPVMTLNEVVNVERGDISNISIYKAQAIPYTEEIAFNSPGIIGNMNVKIGDTVHKGDLLGELTEAKDNARVSSLQNDIDNKKNENEEVNVSAKYDIKIMEIEKKQLNKKLKSSSGKTKKKIINEIAVKDADIQIAKQQLKDNEELQEIEIAELERQKRAVEEEIKDYSIYATMDGVVTFAKEIGGQVTAADLAVSISDSSQIYVKSAFVSSKEYNGSNRCYVDFEGTQYDVKERPYDAAEVKQLFEDEIPVFSYFDLDKMDVSFKVGDYLDLHLETEGKIDVLQLPVNAVYTEKDRSYVYKKVGDSKVMTDVQTGIKSTSCVEIVSGLEEGDTVYVKP